MIVFYGDKARFGRSAFCDAIRELYRSGDASAAVKDDDGDDGSIERGEDAGRKILNVRNAQASFQLHGFVALHHAANFGIDAFDVAPAYAGLGRDSLADWIGRMPAEPLAHRGLPHPDDTTTPS